MNVRAQGGSKYTPLIYASKYGDKELAKLLIDKGADVNATDGGE